MAKIKTKFVCQECGYETLKWLGKCPECGKWNTITEEKEQKQSTNSRGSIRSNSLPKSIINIKSGEYERFNTNIKELNRVLGGGLVKGSLTLISGDPGIGKSTLLLQTAGNIANEYGKVLYVSGEESEEQIKMRADRLNIHSENLFVLSETNIENVEFQIDQIKPVFVIIDSIQTLFKEALTSAPGSVSQVRECSNDLMRIGKSNSIPLFIVAHVTKQGELAGPRVLEHMVDTVLHFSGERTQEYRILRTIKNRFGTTSEIGVFEMRGEGLMEVLNPSKVFLEDTNYKKEGSAVIGIVEGSRPVLVEIQALVSETKAIMPRRTSVGVDTQRLNLILAVLEKKLKVPFYNADVYVNIVGGLNIDGTYGDLGIAISLLSSVKDKPIILERALVIGEVGLTGEIRPVAHCEKIVNEGKKLGFTNFIVPQKNKISIDDNNQINIIYVSSLRECIRKVFN
ncbi:DNA repair protein RadA [Hathewaya histolytica]|uniref:DNA repair protein RadA n=1 Tax=Hathewaya histolytica TaxID=1498 RepID=A0A4U9RSX6_HATHI|nr:DNA repair protein RadA [Hathewaya histolytica]VTQ95229.1 DNA repair protein RadA [Hathewaya histolytica]